MARTVLLDALALAAPEWLEYRSVARAFSTEIYIVSLALGFMGFGLWEGRRLTLGPPFPVFER